MKILAEDKMNKREISSFFKTGNQPVKDAILCLTMHSVYSKAGVWSIFYIMGRINSGISWPGRKNF